MDNASHVLLGTYLAFMVLAVAWLHRDLLIAAAGLDHGGVHRLSWL
jgi:hypothetical protein